MNDQTLNQIVEELRSALVGHRMGKLFQLARARLAIDFRPDDGRYLLISAESNQPRMHLIRRTVRELEKQSLPPSPFALALRKHIGGAILRALTKDEGDRIVRFAFDAQTAIGDTHTPSLIVQLTGRTANLFLLDEHGRILDSLRPSHGKNHEVADLYEAPPAFHDTQSASPQLSTPPFERGEFASLSDAADAYYQHLERTRLFDQRAAEQQARLRKEFGKRRKLGRNLSDDLRRHGDAEEHKRIGDLLLANIATAERRGGVVRLTDYYAEHAPIIELEIDENRTLQEEAARAFARYTKAKHARQEIAQRLEKLAEELAILEAQRHELERIIEAGDEAALDAFRDEAATKTGGKRKANAPENRSKNRREETVPGARRYRSSDGYEILVGRAARDNDHLTFHVARPSDWWFHAADYPGSHVIVRNHTPKTEVPQRTLIEAAQLAAGFSQARKDSKVSVHYTQRKFLSKPKGAVPGLVRLSNFRTLLVEPGENIERV
ncbi:MAG: NFACT family protein [Pyrinomonadaceae bacterium]|nr:NFACT family protein [Pyrinomonadaceae bacterium]